MARTITAEETEVVHELVGRARAAMRAIEPDVRTSATSVSDSVAGTVPPTEPSTGVRVCSTVVVPASCEPVR